MPRWKHLAASLVFLAPVLNSALAVAQETVPVQDQPLCPSCTFELSDAIRLGSFDGPDALPALPLRFEIDGRGRYWLVFSFAGAPMVFRPDGQLEGVVGRRGQGPGEFLAAAGLLLAPGDSMVVFDVRQRRATVVSPDLDSTRPISLPGTVGWGAVVRWPDSVLVHGNVYSASAAGFPVHLVDLSSNSMTIIESFGSSSRLIPDKPQERVRRMTAVRNGYFWTAETTRFRAHRWRARDLTLLESLDRRPEWFAGESTAHIGSNEVAPAPSVDALVQDDEGLLWLFVRVPRVDWADAWDGPPPLNANGEVNAEDLPSATALWRTRVEVIDPAMRKVVARGDFDRLVIGAFPGAVIRIGSIELDDLGAPFLRIENLDLRGFVVPPP